jgi:ATP-dependent DNA helicase RecQ
VVTSGDTDPIGAAAYRVFGHRKLRPGQREAVQALLDGHDVLLIEPTGGGKSLAYQLPAVLLDGPTVVVSPLLALQKDQMERLTLRGRHTRAGRLSSAEGARERRETLEAMARGEVEFLFLAPEQLANDEVRSRVAALAPSLIAVDEAHCVSSWGHDFRPDYAQLGALLDDLAPDGGARPRLVAMTATAAPPVRDDIVARLRLQQPTVIVGGTARENIYLAVRRCMDEDDQQDGVVEAATSLAGPGIVYLRTRAATERYADELTRRGLRASPYHGGLGTKARNAAQVDFMAGDVDVMVATSAFGMGVDKPDIRFVLHGQAPESPDSYYQEVGRAGRDGQPAVAILFYRPEDLGLATFFTAPVPKARDVEKVVVALATSDEEVPSRPALARSSGLGPRTLGRILNLMEELEPDGGGESEVDRVVNRAEAYRAMQKSRIEMMRAYAETQRCRRQFLLSYFGETDPGLCGDCDSCRTGSAEREQEQAEDAAESPFRHQDPVHHEAFGDGLVMSLDGEEVTVLFDDVGYRTLHLPTVVEHELLRPRQVAAD